MSADRSSIKRAIVDALNRIPAPGTEAVMGGTDTEIAAGGGTLQLGRSGTSELLALVPVPPDTVGMNARAGISLTVQRLKPSPAAEPQTFLVLTCHRPHLEETFLDLIALMAELFVANPHNAADTMQRQFVRWRELFSELPRSELSTGQQAGALAELMALQQICSIGGPTVIDLWQGPAGARHDFLDPPHSLEVKAVISATIDRVTVHGVEQLLAVPGGTLHMAVYRLEPDTGDRTIAHEFQCLVDRGVDALELREKLQTIGVLIGDGVSSRGWRLAEERLYRVDESFPRIVPSSFKADSTPEGVSDIRYSVRLGGIAPLADEFVGEAWTRALRDRT